MATFASTDTYLSIASNDLSDYVTSVDFGVSVDELESQTMGDTWKERIAGLKDGQMSITFNQDVAAGALDSIMWPLLGTVVAFEVRATSSAVGASNPKWTGNIFIKEWNPISGSVGDLVTVSVSFPTSGAVTRAVA